MYSSNLKKSDTILRVSKLLLGLLTKPMDYEEIFKYLDEKVENTVYTTEVLNKYLNTLRALGLKIEKRYSKYHLTNFLVQVDLTEDEIEAFNKMEENILKYGTENNIKTFVDIKRKIIKFLDEKSQNSMNHCAETVFATGFSELIKKFEKLCDDGQKIKIEYDNEIFTVEPRKLSYIENKIYFDCFISTNLKVRKLLLEKIKLVEQQPVKNSNIEIFNSVTYELSGKLAHIYKLKEDEILLAQDNDKIVIKNKKEDYEFLAKKLIKYKNYCKIISPNEFKEYFINYTDKILKKYEAE